MSKRKEQVELLINIYSLIHRFGYKELDGMLKLIASLMKQKEVPLIDALHHYVTKKNASTGKPRASRRDEVNDRDADVNRRAS